MSTRKTVAALVLGAAALLAAYILMAGPSVTREISTASAPPAIKAESTALVREAEESPQPSAAVSRGLARVLVALRDGAGSPSGVAHALELLRETKRTALSAEPSAAAAAIVAALEAGDDAATGLGFVVGAGGMLSESPTYRTALLDLLGRVDPHAAAACARALLHDPAVTPDEYAIALRNLAHGPRAGFPLAELRAAFAAMVSREDWRSNPTTGFLEAFDAAVQTSAFGEVAPWIVDPGAAPESAVSRAAFIAADRIMLSDPATVVAAFRSEPGAMSTAPFHRASLLSRLDVRDASQQALLKDYLLRADLTSGEMEYFLGIFPNGNAFAGHTLVTRGAVSGPDIDAVSRIDEATAATLRSWILLPEFSAANDGLRRVIDRLENSAPRSP